MNESAKVGASIVIIGYQGAGKTPIAKQLKQEAGMRNNIVFDIRHEYPEDEFTTFHDFEKFKKFISTAKDCLIIFEEATAYIGFFRDLELINLITGVEHNRLVIIFLFHSIKSVPHFVIELSRFVILLNTNDSPELIKSQRPLLYKYMDQNRDWPGVTIDVRQEKY